MAAKYKNLSALQTKKILLKKEIESLEDLLTFKDKKESLSAITNGFTDQFLKETVNKEGKKSLALDTQNLMKKIASEIKEKSSKNNLLNLANDGVQSGLLGTAAQVGTVALVSNFAKKNMMNKNWKRRILGLALVYLAPYALRYIRKKLDEYQRNKTTASMEKLI